MGLKVDFIVTLLDFNIVTSYRNYNFLSLSMCFHMKKDVPGCYLMSHRTIKNVNIDRKINETNTNDDHCGGGQRGQTFFCTGTEE